MLPGGERTGVAAVEQGEGACGGRAVLGLERGAGYRRTPTRRRTRVKHEIWLSSVGCLDVNFLPATAGDSHARYYRWVKDTQDAPVNFCVCGISCESIIISQ